MDIPYLAHTLALQLVNREAALGMQAAFTETYPIIGTSQPLMFISTKELTKFRWGFQTTVGAAYGDVETEAILKERRGALYRYTTELAAVNLSELVTTTVTSVTNVFPKRPAPPLVVPPISQLSSLKTTDESLYPHTYRYMVLRRASKSIAGDRIAPLNPTLGQTTSCTVTAKEINDILQAHRTGLSVDRDYTVQYSSHHSTQYRLKPDLPAPVKDHIQALTQNITAGLESKLVTNHTYYGFSTVESL